MTAAALLAHLHDRGIRLWAEGDQLRFEAPKGALTKELRDAVVAQKPELLALLTQSGSIAARPAGGEMPLSFAQQRLWFLNQYDTEGDAQYNVTVALALSGALRVDALRAALQTIAERHASLRTRFGQRDGVPYQIVDPSPEIAMPIIEIDRGELAERVDAHVRHTFDLENGPLWKVDLMRLDAHEHVLLVNIHHIACDGPSFQVLFSELTELYPAFADGKPNPLPALPIQYSDYAWWQRQWVEQGRAGADLAYWKEQLRGAPPLLALPTDRPRPAVATHHGASVPFRLPRSLHERLNALGRSERATLFAILLAAFKVLLWRHSQQRDVLVGAPVTARNQPVLEGLIGFFVNTLALRTEIDPHESFSALLRRVRTTLLEAQDHQDIPFDYLVNELSPQRSLSHSPIVQVMLAFQRDALRALHLPGIEARRLEQNRSAARFDIGLSILETPDDLTGTCEYNTDLFDRATIERLLDHYRRLLEAIVADPGERVSRYELLSERERLQFAQWNRTQDYPRNQTMHGLVEAQAERVPDAIALVFEGQHLTYRAWNARANQLAHYLLGQGVRPEMRVGLCLERSLDMMIAMLAVLKAGGAYVPLDPSYPQARLDYIVSDAQVQCVITESGLRDHLSVDVNFVCLDEVRSLIAQESDEAPVVPLVSQNLAYVIHTSGSTGHPKGVMIAHRNVVNLAYSQQTRLANVPGERVLQFASLNFDSSVWEFVMAWTRGAALVLGSRERMLPGEEMAALMNQEAVDIATLPPSALAVLSPEALPAFKVLISAGEALSPAQVRPWLEGRIVLNGYGPTESTVDASVGDIRADEPITIGRAIPNIAFYILDDALQPVPVGVAGELFIGGAGLARGYLDRPALTAERFLPNPFDTAGSRMYRTGDLARHRPNGTVELLGRTDHQVKIRGFRVELGEIEATLERHPAVAQALVIASGEGQSKRLIAYYTGGAAGFSPPDPDGGVKPAAPPPELRAFLKKTLPEHMVPAFFIALDAFPLMPNGKIDRAVLPEPGVEGTMARQYQAPRTPVEETLAGIWQQVLHVPKIGVRDGFFEIGGHSLLATQAISRINDVFSLALPVRALFEAPDIESLARRIESEEATGQIARLPLVPVERTGALPLSFAQQRLWFLSQLEGASYTYNISSVLRLRGPLDDDALGRALHAIVDRHEVLRTRFREIDGVPMQVIDPAGTFVIRRQRLETPDALAPLVDEELHYRFDLSRDALFRVLLIEEAPGSHVLLFVVHHSIADGWSLGVLMNELTALYTAFHEGRPSPLAPLAIQYADYAHWQRELLTGDLLAAETEYWKEALANLTPMLDLPTDRPRPPVLTYRGAHEPFRLSSELTEQLVALSRKSGATLFMTLLAAFDILLSRYSGQTDIAVGTPVANRTRPELESLIGFFINNLVLRADLSGNPAFTTLLRKVRETALNAYAHQDVPFEYLVEQLNPTRSLSYSPLFQVMLVLQNAPPASVSLPELDVTLLPFEQATTKFDLVFSLTETPEGLSGALEYSTDLFDRSTIERMLGHYRRLLEAIVANPEERVSRYELLSEPERRQLVQWNRTQDYPRDQTMHGLVEAQAEQNPDVIALVFEGEHLTYRAWNARANQLARYLIGQGVGPEMRVGLCLDRSLDLMIAILGVLKAGGAYVPLDPSYPQARLDYIVNDAQVQCVITQSHLRDRVGEDVHFVCLDEVKSSIAQQSVEAPDVPVVSQNLAYVIHTSGSTGHPKGVMIAHRSVVNLTYAQQKRLEDIPGSRVLQFASFSFDGSVWEFVMAWIRGGTLVLGPKEHMLEGDALTALMNREAIDIATLPPSALAVLSPEALPAFKVLISAGEALSLAQVTPWLEGRTVMNGYGPTESTVDASVGDIRGDEPITIGRPIPNIAFHLLDSSTFEPVPIGVAGEVYIGGEGLARGYLNRPGLTAERFLPNPFGAPGSRMYRTGDLARYRPNGTVEILGRCDHQVKIRGFRIELGEIEATLERHPAVAQALVIASGEGESKRLLAYYTTHPNGAAQTSELRAFLKTTLPEHMVPAFFIALDAFPLTPNGKIDRAALPAPDVAGSIAEQYAAPRTPAEHALAGIWQQVLHVPQVGVRDHFFEIGGHSLLATQAISRINDLFSLALPVRALFEAPDIESLARRIESEEATGRIARLPLVPVARTGALPLSFAQQRLWFLSKLEGPSYTYNLSVVMRLQGPLDGEALIHALEAIVARHEVLRTRFREIDGVPVQVIDSATGFAVRRPKVSSPEALAALIDEELHYRFDVSRDALFRALLIDEAPASQVLALNLHHSIADGWSLGVLLHELMALYTAFHEGRPSPLPPLTIQYADFAHWQRELLTGDLLAAETEYWKEALANLTPMLDLPTDRPRPPVLSYRGAHEPFRLSSELTEQLVALSRKSGATLFMTLLAAFDVLLSRYSGQTEIAVGTPVANRTRPELESLIGFFINNLVLRADLSGNPTFTALLEKTRETALNAYAHQDVPFEYLVEQLNPTRSLSYSPLFQVMLVLQNAPFSAMRLPELEVTPLSYEQATTKFDLVFSMAETPEGLTGALEYSTDLFDRSTIERMLDHYRRLLEAIVANPEERVSRYELLSEPERRQLVQWNRTQDYPRDQTMHGLVEAQAEQNPDATALVFAGQHLSYRAWNARANQLARYLIGQGVGPEMRVGLCLDRSLDLMIAILGVLKAGGAYVPLDPSYPQARLDYIVSDAQVQCVITQSHLRDRVGEDVHFVCLDEVKSSIAQQSVEAPDVPIVSQNLAYVIHTSGSTGHPKGVMIAHRSVVNLTYAQQKRLEDIPGTRVLQFASFSFDGSVWEFVMAWIRGGTLVLGPKEHMLEGDALTALMNREAIDIATLPPSALAVLSPEALPAFKVLISAGEALSLAQVTPWLEGRTVMNGYGPTESTVDASVGDIRGDEPITIGRPIPNIAFHLLDSSTFEPVPIGVAGEVYIGGEGLARGYLNRPGLTAERFLPNPFGAPGSRMYRTGDLARYRPNGTVEILGRCDHQVKIRGFRIELGEIEATLERHPAVAQALVIASGEGESKRLLAYYTTNPNGAAQTSELRAFLKTTLPEHMVPAFFIALDAFPLTPNGKIDRAALPAPDVAGSIAERYVAPRTPAEQALVEIWQQVLHVPQVGVHDNFFEIGGHSLLATQAVSRINDLFSLALPVRALFEAPDIENLARRVEGAEAAGQIARLPLVPIPRTAPLPLSFAQQRLWFMSKLEGPSYTYNLSVVMRLRGSLDEDALTGALETIVARHEVLRTRFREIDGVPIQVIDRIGEFAVRRPQLPSRDTLAAFIDEELHYPFDLSRDALFRALLLEDGPEAQVLILNLHHSIADGWSLGVLMKELTALYDAFRDGRPSPLPPLPIQYADYAHWQRHWLTGDVLAAETGYWKEALANLPPMLDLPTDRPRPPVQSYRGAHELVLLPDDLTARLIALSQKSGGTLFMTLLAAFNILLSRYSGQTDIAVGTPVANRTRPELEPLIGFFINTLVMRADLTGDPTFAALLEKTRETALNAYAHQEVPFEYLVEQLNPARSLSYSPLFQVMLVLQNAPYSAVQLPGVEVTPIPHEQRTTKVDLTLSLTEAEGGLSGALEYNTDLFDRATIQRMLDHYRRLLEAIVANPEERISRYELLSEPERRQLVVHWNRNEEAYPQDETMHGLVEAQAERNPDATALVFEGQHLSYRAWNARANQLARYLIARGVGPEVRVGLCLERSLDLMIAILGVLKAGGAYVPLDPSYPKARLDYVVSDAQVQCVITESHLRDHVGQHVDFVCLDEVRPAIAQQSAEAPEVAVVSQNLAYVIHTSGSTGQPKGVMIAHRSVVNLAYAQQKRLEGVPGSRVLQFASFSFDGAVWEFLMAWVRGAALVLAPKERLLPGEGMAALMNREAIDIATLPPSALAVLSPESLPAFKALISAGEALSLAQVRPWLKGRTVMNGYGPTESTVDASVGDIRGDDLITIGRPIPNITFYLLDSGTLHPVPIGVPGELYIGGAGLARGYLNRPGLTADRFIPNPFGAPGSRIYRTGDLARYRPDGTVEILGRCDHQVKIRGFRIELGEIEATLERHPAIAQALVIASGEGESRRLIAYYTTSGAAGFSPPSVDGALPTPADGASRTPAGGLKPAAPPPSELRAFLKTTLPEHMVPSFFIDLDAFPLTPNGKIDRAALPAPDVGGTIAKQYAPPRTPIEHSLVRIWEQVLHVPRVGIHDHFFEIGGHSLLVVQLITRIEHALNVDIPVIELYKHPTVAALAAYVTRIAGEERSPRNPETSASPLVVLSARESRAPLVVIPGIVGVLHGYYDFAQAAGELRPVYGLHASSMQEIDIRHTVESIARLYVSSLLEVWDRGPFHILGHSYGGIIAFEMVRQLEQQGHQPGSLILVDADPLALKMKELAPNVFVLHYMLRFLRLDDVALADAAEGLESAGSERLAAVLSELVSGRHPDGSFGYERMDQWVRTIQSRYIDAYAPAPYRPAADVLEIWAQHGAIQRVAGDSSATWQQILQKQTRRVVMPGDHESVIQREHAPRLARLVNDWIERTVTESFHPPGSLQRLGETT
jgi:amino acid adenylation domain-containing protein